VPISKPWLRLLLLPVAFGVRVEAVDAESAPKN
jgi:hypothetical protein